MTFGAHYYDKKGREVTGTQFYKTACEERDAQIAALQEQVQKMEIFKSVFETWQDKTEWVQGDKRFDVLLPWGKHRADVLKEYIERLEEQVQKLAGEVQGIKWIVLAVSDDDYAAANNHCQRLVGEIANFNSPATDTYANQLRVEGVEMFVAQKMAEAEKYDSNLSREIAIAAKVFAARLRAGAVS